MNDRPRTRPAEGSGGLPQSEAWLFAQALLGRCVRHAASERAATQVRREHVAWLADVSTEYEGRQLDDTRAASSAAAERAQLEWLATFSTEHELELRRVRAAEATAAVARARLNRLERFS